jgi:hypothetical protein
MYRAGKFVRKHRAAVAAGTLAIAALAAALAVSALLYMRSEMAREQTEWLAYLAAIAAADAHIRTAESDIPGQSNPLRGGTFSARAAAREAERRLISVPRQLRGWEWYYLVRKLDASITTLWGTTDPTTAYLTREANPYASGANFYQGPLAISQDGTALFWSTGEGVHVWDLSSYRLTAAWRGYGRVTAISEDGSKLISADWAALSPWRIVNTKTGSVVSTLRTNASNIRLAAFSLDGERVATASDDGVVRIWLAHSGEQIAQAQVSGFLERIRFGPTGDSLVVVTNRALSAWRLGSVPRAAEA